MAFDAYRVYKSDDGSSYKQDTYSTILNGASTTSKSALTGTPIDSSSEPALTYASVNKATDKVQSGKFQLWHIAASDANNDTYAIDVNNKAIIAIPLSSELFGSKTDANSNLVIYVVNSSGGLTQITDYSISNTMELTFSTSTFGYFVIGVKPAS
jgi:hypothetical protein